jgi:hypothetical protein
MKVKELRLNEQNDRQIITIVKNFFTADEQWGRLNRSQFIIGLECTITYFIINILFRDIVLSSNTFPNSSNGLLASVFICIGISIVNFFDHIPAKYPWYEKFMPKIITLLGLITLIAVQNLDSKGIDDISLWMDIVILLVLFIIAAGYFVEGVRSERVIKIWFALLGYYFSLVAFFYLLETLFH